MMLLHRFFFFSLALSPCSNMQILVALLSTTPIGHIGGPWWLLQPLSSVCTTKVIGLPTLSDGTFHSSSFTEGEEPIPRSTMYLNWRGFPIHSGWSTIRRPISWFNTFYYGLSEDVVGFACYVAAKFNIPSKFRIDNPLVDHESLAHLIAFILLQLLFVGITPGRSRHMSYEFYHLLVCARQLGFY
jgi:hypothetical protein